MSNGGPIISAGQVPRQPTYWDDLTLVTKVLQANDTYAPGVAALIYAANGTAWPGVSMTSVAFSRSSPGDVIAAAVGHTHKIYAVKLICDTAAVVKWQYNTVGGGGAVDIEGAQSIVAGGGYVENVDPPCFLFETFDNASLAISVSGGGTASGRVSYWSEVSN